MEFTQDMLNMVKDNCIILNKHICDLVQAAWEYYKKAVKILKISGFFADNVDQCLYVEKSEKGIVT